MFGRLAEPTRLRLLLLLGLQTVLALLANRIFDRIVWPYLAIAPIIGLVIVASLRFRRSIRVVLAVVAVLAGVIITVWWAGGPLITYPNGEGFVQLVSTEWPTPVTFRTISAIGFILAVISAISDRLVVQTEYHLAPLAPIGIGGLTMVGLSAPAGPAWGLWIVGAIIALVFCLVHPTTPLRMRASTLAGERTLFASVALGAVAIAVAFAFTPTGDRADPRQLDSPEQSAPLVDPIEATIAMRNSEPKVDLFGIRNKSTLEGSNTPSYWRTTALSRYDGQRWLPDSALRPIGYRLSNLPEDSAPIRAPISFDIEVQSTRLGILPFPGVPLVVEAPVNTDTDRVIVQLREQPEVGTVIDAQSLIQPNRTDVEGRRVADRQIDEFSGSFSEIARQIAGDGSGIGQLDAIESTMREQWSLDPEQPGSGQQFALIERFVRETNRGTREQFATGFVLLARSLGYDARVATGFVIPPEEATDNIVLDTSQAAVWPEVRVDGLGWIRFDPTPPTVTDQGEQPEPKQRPQSPAVPQPPIAPPVDQSTRTTEPPTIEETPDNTLADIGRALVTVLTYSAFVLLPIVIILGSILGAKAWRRRRRLRTADPVQRVRAAWANTTDSFVDAGLRIGKSDTNLHIASTAEPLAPTTPTETTRLAEMSTNVTFGASQPPDELADQAVELSRAVRRSVAENLSRWQRLRWYLSLRSLWRGTRSPVVP